MLDKRKNKTKRNFKIKFSLSLLQSEGKREEEKVRPLILILYFLTQKSAFKMSKCVI